MDKEFTEDETELSDWLRTIKEILDDPQPDAMDFLDAIKLNLFATEIFVFTPKGEIKTMPQGCTALDFAFSIHTFLGSHCIGAKVNHKLVPLSHKLQSGDQVEILTSKSQHVQESWINFVSTAKAKAKIQAILRRDSRETQRQGEEILSEFLQKNALQDVPNAADRLAEFHEAKTVMTSSSLWGSRPSCWARKTSTSCRARMLAANMAGANSYPSSDVALRQRRTATSNRSCLPFQRSSIARSPSSSPTTTSANTSSSPAVTPFLATIFSDSSTASTR